MPHYIVRVVKTGPSTAYRRSSRYLRAGGNSTVILAHEPGPSGLSFAANCLRNFASFGEMTAWQ
jgi:hypothetical protein